MRRATAMTIRAALVWVCVFASPAVAQVQQNSTRDARPHVLFVLATDGPDDAHWYRALTSHSDLAGQALEMDVERLWVGTERPDVLARVRARLNTEPRPDYIVFANQRGLGRKLLEMADAQGVDTFLYIAPLLDKDRAELGGPRKTLTHWIGELLPDDEQAGYDLARAVIASARQRKRAQGESGPVRLVAIHGRRATTSSHERAKGLERALAEARREVDMDAADPVADVEFLQGVSARWSGETAARKYQLLRRRYGRIDAVWAANDPMAMGVVDSHLRGTDLPVIGGVDWEPPAIAAVADGRLHATMGGHVYDIAWVLALLRAHHDGHDFADALGTVSLTSKLTLMLREDVETYARFEADRLTGDVDYARALRMIARQPSRLGTPSFARFHDAATAAQGPKASGWDSQSREIYP